MKRARQNLETARASLAALGRRMPPDVALAARLADLGNQAHELVLDLIDVSDRAAEALARAHGWDWDRVVEAQGRRAGRRGGRP